MIFSKTFNAVVAGFEKKDPEEGGAHCN